MTNASRKPFYVGFTGRLRKRAGQHKLGTFGGFTSRYNMHRLVHFELFYDPYVAIAREKELKGWSRAKKIALIESKNPNWDDLAREWDKIWKPKNQDASSLLAR